MIKAKCLKTKTRSKSSIVLAHLPKMKDQFKSKLMIHSLSRSVSLCRNTAKTTLNDQKDIAMFFFQDQALYKSEGTLPQSIHSSILSFDDSDDGALDIYNRDLRNHTLNKEQLRSIFPLKALRLAAQRDEIFNSDNKLLEDHQNEIHSNALLEEQNPFLSNRVIQRQRKTCLFDSTLGKQKRILGSASKQYLEFLSVLTTKNHYQDTMSGRYKVNSNAYQEDMRRLRRITSGERRETGKLCESMLIEVKQTKEAYKIQKEEFHPLNSIPSKKERGSLSRMMDRSNCFLKFSAESKTDPHTKDSFVMESIQRDIIQNLEDENAKIRSKIEEVDKENTRLMELLTDCDKLKMIAENFEIFNEGNINLNDSF